VATTADEIQMPVKFEYTCPDCGWTTEWVFEEDRKWLEPDPVTGCPGKNCSKIHRASASEISEEEAEQIRES
jgi:hypothetical protein